MGALRGIGNFAGGLAGGLASGYALGRSIRGDMNDAELADESKALSQKMADSNGYTDKGSDGSSVAMPDQQAAQRYADYNNSIAAEDAKTFGGGLSSAPTTTVEQNPTYTKANYYSDMAQKAAGLGMTSQADRYEQRAEAIQNNERQAKAQDLAIQKDQMQIDAAKEAAASKQRVDNFLGSIQAAHDDAAKNGGNLTWDQIEQMGRDANLKPAEVMSAASALTGLDEQGTKYTAGMRVAQFDKAYHKGGLDGVLDQYHTNPLFDNGQNMQKVVGKDGSVTLMNGKQKLFSGTEGEAAVFLRSQLTDPYSAVKFNMEVLNNQAKLAAANSKLQVDKANIAQSNASAENSLASAAKTRREAKALEANGGLGGSASDVRQNVSAAVKQVLLATGLAKQDPVGNLFMQSSDGKPSSTSEQDIANLSASAEAYVRKGMPPYQAAQQVIKDRDSARAAATPPANRPPIDSFGK